SGSEEHVLLASLPAHPDGLRILSIHADRAIPGREDASVCGNWLALVGLDEKGIGDGKDIRHVGEDDDLSPDDRICRDAVGGPLQLGIRSSGGTLSKSNRRDNEMEDREHTRDHGCRPSPSPPPAAPRRLLEQAASKLSEQAHRAKAN